MGIIIDLVGGTYPVVPAGLRAGGFVGGKNAFRSGGRSSSSIGDREEAGTAS